MAFDPRISNAAAIEMLDTLTAMLDVGGGGYIEIRNGSIPTDVDAAATGTLLSTLQLSNPAFDPAVDLNPGARATANAITQDPAAVASGDASYFRAYRNDGTAIIQGTVDTSNADMIVDNLTIAAGAIVSVTSWTITHGESA